MGRNEGPAHKEHPTGSAHLNAADRHAFHLAHVDDGAKEVMPSYETLALKLARKAEHGAVRRELDQVCRATVDPVEGGPLLGLDRAQTKAGGKLHHSVSETLPRAGELTPSHRVHVAIGVHEPLQQCRPLRLAGQEVVHRYVFVPQEVEIAEGAGEGAVPGVSTRQLVSR